MFRIVSYNCNSFRNNIDIIKLLLDKYDIVLLQELMLLNEDINLVKDLHPDWEAIVGVQDNFNQGIMEGRPQKGVAILWKKSFSELIVPVYVDNSINGIKIKIKDKYIFIINVYMPFDKKDDHSLVNYINNLSIISQLILESNFSDILLMGDFNANYDLGRFGRILKSFLSDNYLVPADNHLPADSFTYLSSYHNTTSWLDHIVCTSSLKKSLLDIEISYDLSLYDHFPLSCVLNIDTNCDLHNTIKAPNNKYVYWNKMSVSDHDSYKQSVQTCFDNLDIVGNDVFFCNEYGCNSEEHIENLNQYMSDIIEVLHYASKNFTIDRKYVKKCVPGWNSYIKPYYLIAQEKFFEWKDNGRLREGEYFELMKKSRDDFKRIMKLCKKNEELIRNEQMVEALNNKNTNKFWTHVRNVKNDNFTQPSLIAGNSNFNSIANIFSDMYKSIFNDSNSKSETLKYSTNINSFDIHYIFNSVNISKAIRKLNPSIGPDYIHTYHLQHSPMILSKILSKYFNACFMHNYLPENITNAVISPLIKNKLGDIHDPSNYRPIFSSSIFLKVLEYSILEKIKSLFQFNDRQHGFREGHSVTTATMLLKETILNYSSKGSRVFACFLDLSKAFDKVCHGILFEKLKKTGIPDYIINILQYLYSHQKVYIRYESGVSKDWYIGNGVRQGGILSPWFFNLYIDEILERVSSAGIGCRFGLTSSNIIGYADDLVILAPSSKSLQNLINILTGEIDKLKLLINKDKTVCMTFAAKKVKLTYQPFFKLKNYKVKQVKEIKYLGTIINDTLSDGPDIIRCRNAFFNSFNSILRKFNSLEPNTMLFLFKSFCTHMFGADLWIDSEGCGQILQQFGVGFHKCIKKIYKVSSRESNHIVCNFANIMLFKHLINYIKIRSIHRICNKPCYFIEKNFFVFNHVSFYMRKIKCIASEEYNITSIFENDIDAIQSRIFFVQFREETMR